MTAQPIDPATRGMWSPDPVRQRLASYTMVVDEPFDVRLRVRDICP